MLGWLDYGAGRSARWLADFLAESDTGFIGRRGGAGYGVWWGWLGYGAGRAGSGVCAIELERGLITLGPEWGLLTEQEVQLYFTMQSSFLQAKVDECALLLIIDTEFKPRKEVLKTEKKRNLIGFSQKGGHLQWFTSGSALVEEKDSNNPKYRIDLAFRTVDESQQWIVADRLIFRSSSTQNEGRWWYVRLYQRPQCVVVTMLLLPKNIFGQ